MLGLKVQDYFYISDFALKNIGKTLI